MQIKKYLALAAGTLSLAFCACNNDDDGDTFTIEIRDVAEQTAADDERMVEFFKTHFYNYEDFANGETAEIVFDTISGENAEKTSLFDQLGSQLTETTISFSGINHKVYVLKAREGSGETLSFADSIFVKYKGVGLDEFDVDDSSEETVFGLGSTFDSSATPIWFNPNGTIPGFMMGLNGFKGASSVVLGEDGFLEPQDAFGIGAVFIPSFLAYYEQNVTGSTYHSLIFTFDVISGKVLDHDDDGVPSKDEDANNNLILTDDDTDGDGTPDFLDEDTL